MIGEPHALFQRGKAQMVGGYSVMDFTLDSIVTENKGWICLQPIVFEEAVGFFLANHHMEERVGVSRIEDEKKKFILLTVFQHGLNDRMKGFLCREQFIITTHRLCFVFRNFLQFK